MQGFGRGRGEEASDRLRMVIPRGTPTRLRGLLQFRQVSIRQLSRAVGWRSHNSLERVLTGEARTISGHRARKLAEVLSVEVHDLFLPNVTTADRQDDDCQSSGRAA